MVRRLVLILLVVGIAVGGYYAWSWLHVPPEETQGPPEEQPYYEAPPPRRVAGIELVQHELAGALAVAPGQGFPGTVPWQPLDHVAASKSFLVEKLVHEDPLRFLELCAERYGSDVKGYNLLFVKKERVKGKLHPPKKDEYEIIKVAFRERPFSVLFVWKENPRTKIAGKALYVEGENGNKILGRAKLLPIIREYDLDSADARDNGRYTMAEFGIGKGIHRTVKAMEKAKARDKLFLRYEGQVVLKEAGDRPCYKFVRTPYDPPEDDDGVYELTTYIDCETWLQVGSILYDSSGQLLAEYFFRDIELNPDFPLKQFTRGAL